MRDGGPSWYGVIADTNPPDTDHWWSILSGEAVLPDYITKQEAKMLVKPDNWIFFNQPPALLEDYNKDKEIEGYKDNPNKENGKNLTKNYYESIIRGKSKSWIDVYVLNKLGQIEDGKPVYEMFRKDVHVAKRRCSYITRCTNLCRNRLWINSSLCIWSKRYVTDG